MSQPHPLITERPFKFPDGSFGTIVRVGQCSDLSDEEAAFAFRATIGEKPIFPKIAKISKDMGPAVVAKSLSTFLKGKFISLPRHCPRGRLIGMIWIIGAVAE